MAHPKRRISKSVKNKRRSHLAIKLPQINRDPVTGVARLPHRVHESDTHYGFEKGRSGGFQVQEQRDF